MTYYLQINNYSYNDQERFCIKQEGDNFSRIFDKIIDLAACKCDAYGSDVFWDMHSFVNAIKEEQSFDRLLCFRPTGVISGNVMDLCTFSKSSLSMYEKETYVWRLSHKLAINEQDKLTWVNKFERVRCKVVEDKEEIFKIV